jgi:hypothetical protein
LQFGANIFWDNIARFNKKKFIFVDVGSEVLIEKVIWSSMTYRVENPSLNKPKIKEVLLAVCIMLVTGLAYASTLMMEMSCFSDTSVEF